MRDMPADQTTLASEPDLKIEELAIRREEARAKLAADRRNVWFASPLLLGLVGLLGTGIGAGLQGFWNARLEKQKFEASLIEKALAAADRNEAARSLKFLVDAGLINGLNTENIRTLAETPQQLPAFFGPAIRDALISARDAKTVLQRLGFYTGTINDELDEDLRKAVADFQADRKIEIDGLIGGATLLKLREALPEYFEAKISEEPSAGPVTPSTQK